MLQLRILKAFPIKYDKKRVFSSDSAEDILNLMVFRLLKQSTKFSGTHRLLRLSKDGALCLSDISLL